MRSNTRNRLVSRVSMGVISRLFNLGAFRLKGLRDICLRLAQAGHFPKRGGQWYPQTVKLLMVSS